MLIWIQGVMGCNVQKRVFTSEVFDLQFRLVYILGLSKYCKYNKKRTLLQHLLLWIFCSFCFCRFCHNNFIHRHDNCSPDTVHLLLLHWNWSISWGSGWSQLENQDSTRNRDACSGVLRVDCGWNLCMKFVWMCVVLLCCVGVFVLFCSSQPVFVQKVFYIWL